MEHKESHIWQNIFLGFALFSIMVSSSIISFRVCELMYPGMSPFKETIPAHASIAHRNHRNKQDTPSTPMPKTISRIATDEPASIPDESRMETISPDEADPNMGIPANKDMVDSSNPGNPIKPASPKRIPVLMYHCVNDKTTFKNATESSLTLPTKVFAGQLDWLISHGYHVISLDEAYAAMVSGTRLPDKPVVLTFDDGAPDAYANVFPELRKRGISGTFFVIVERVATGESLDWPEVAEMADAGMQIESHTMTHAHLPSGSPSKLIYELQQSKALLEQHLKRPVRFFAYPFGSYNQRVVDEVKKSGYLAAFTTHSGIWKLGDNLLTIKRVRVSRGETIQSFAKLLFGSTYGKSSKNTRNPAYKSRRLPLKTKNMTTAYAR